MAPQTRRGGPLPHSEAAILKVLRLKSATANHSAFHGSFAADRWQNVRVVESAGSNRRYDGERTKTLGLTDWLNSDFPGRRAEALPPAFKMR